MQPSKTDLPHFAQLPDKDNTFVTNNLLQSDRDNSDDNTYYWYCLEYHYATTIIALLYC
jgi:hypothetical protein